MSVYQKADPGELIQWVTHESRSSAASNSGLIRIGTQPRTADAWHHDSCRPRGIVTRDFLAIFDRLFDRLPVRISTSDLHHWILRKKLYHIRAYDFGVQFSFKACFFHVSAPVSALHWWGPHRAKQSPLSAVLQVKCWLLQIFIIGEQHVHAPISHMLCVSVHACPSYCAPSPVACIHFRVQKNDLRSNSFAGSTIIKVRVADPLWTSFFFAAELF